jgi:hypothetical protein
MFRSPGASKMPTLQSMNAIRNCTLVYGPICNVLDGEYEVEIGDAQQDAEVEHYIQGACYNSIPKYCRNPFATCLLSKISRISSFLFLSLRLISYTKSKKSHLISFCFLYFSGFKILYLQRM